MTLFRNHRYYLVLILTVLVLLMPVPSPNTVAPGLLPSNLVYWTSPPINQEGHRLQLLVPVGWKHRDPWLRMYQGQELLIDVKPPAPPGKQRTLQEYRAYLQIDIRRRIQVLRYPYAKPWRDSVRGFWLLDSGVMRSIHPRLPSSHIVQSRC